MPIPQFQEFMTPALNALKDGVSRTHGEVEDIVCPLMGISQAERQELLPSGTQTIVRNRLSWAMYNMYRAGLLARSRRGVYHITESGTKALASTTRIDNEFLDQYEGFRIFQNTSHKKDNMEVKPSSLEENIDPVTRIGNAIEEFNKKTCQDLLEQLMDINEIRFEKICLDLMIAMGYAEAEMVSLTQKSHDRGIDGIVKEDALGLDIIYTQAKRYTNGKVGEVEVRNFIGALDEVRKGVFFTTSSFSEAAKEKAKRASGKKIILVDGEEMARLMLKYNVGVRVKESYQIKQLDENYFSENE